jgi:hypothetical protein
LIKEKRIFNLYDNFFLKKHINSLSKIKGDLEIEIENNIINVLSPSQKEIYIKSLELLKEYIKSTIKSKRIKEKYKNIVDNLSLLYTETSIPIHKYLCLKYDITIVVNDIKKKENNLKTERMFTLLKIEEFEKLLHKFEEIIKSIQQKQKYNSNTLINLNETLSDYIKNKDTFEKNIY